MAKTPEEREAHKARVAERQRNYVAERTAHARSLAQVAGAVTFTDPRGFAWGVKTFTFRELETFQADLASAIFRISTADNIKTRVQWAAFLQKCVVCHDQRVGLRITIRRALGLPDYSIRTLLKNLVDYVPPTILNAVVFANYEKATLAEFLQMPEKKKSAEQFDSGYDDLMASFFYHKDILPKDFFDMTLSQVGAINDYAKREAEEERHRRTVEAMKARAGRS